jgi:DNA topoisomerase-3
METAGKRVDDEQVREAMKERGLGTPATRAAIIELLVNRQYIQREGRNLRVTSKGLKLIEILDGHSLTSPEMTGKWEQQLRDMEQGKLGHDEFIKSSRSLVKLLSRSWRSTRSGCACSVRSLGRVPTVAQ